MQQNVCCNISRRPLVRLDVRFRPQGRQSEENGVRESMNTPTSFQKARTGRLMSLAFVGLFAVATYNIFKISVLDNNKYQQMANSYHFGSIPIPAHRGSIYDTNGIPMARSATVYRIFLDPGMFKEEMKELDKQINENRDKGGDPSILPATAELFKNEAVAFLTEKLQVSPEVITKAMEAETRYSIIKSKVEKQTADEVLAFFGKYKLGSLRADEDSKRYYPQNEIAASVIGFTNSDGIGIYGVESYYDKYLAGTDGRTISAKDSNGNEMPYRYATTYPAKNGDDLYLTIDTTLQYYLEKHLQNMVTKFEVQNRACAILMNAKTGAVYGMASCPSFDLNNPYDVADPLYANRIAQLTGDEAKELTGIAREAQWKNKAITEIYEPGSVFKVITSAAAIEEGLIDTYGGDSFYCSGSETVMGEPIKCHKFGGHGGQTFQKALTNSCNPAFMQIGARLGIDKFFYYFKSFGLTEKTCIDLPAEVSSIYRPLEEMTALDLATAAFGQNNTITPMEMITSYAAVVNGGYLLQPYTVSKIIDSEGNIILNNKRTVRRQVISEETSAKMRTALENVVNDNSGGNAYIKGYRIGGKSGTSQKLGMTGKSEKQEYVASYVCFAPANDPEIILLVMADMPKTEYYGSKVAVPTARNILSEVLPYLGYIPEYSANEYSKRDIKIPMLQNSKVEDAKKTVTDLGLKFEVIGEGTTVLRQSPITGSFVAFNGIVYLYTTTESDTEYTTVPNLKGHSAATANEAIANKGLNMVAIGASIERADAVVSEQSIPAGTQVPKGTVIKLEFLVNENSD